MASPLLLAEEQARRKGPQGATAGEPAQVNLFSDAALPVVMMEQARGAAL